VKLCAYVRVSTDAQADGEGPDLQRAAIKEWAAGQHAIASWHEDLGASGTLDLDTRDGLRAAFSEIRDGNAKGLVVYRLDRLARDMVLQETFIRELRSVGAVVRSTSAAEDGMLGDDTADPSRTMIRQILGAVAQYERSMIGLRMAAGREAKRRRGEYAGGRPPYGWRASEGRLVPHEEETETLEAIWAMRDHLEWGYGRIAARLNDHGLMTRHNGVWHETQVARVLHRGLRPGDDPLAVPAGRK
jgi:DNA invertase Pin-like site-specific DNA recombinase